MSRAFLSKSNEQTNFDAKGVPQRKQINVTAPLDTIILTLRQPDTNLPLHLPLTGMAGPGLVNDDASSRGVNKQHSSGPQPFFLEGASRSYLWRSALGAKPLAFLAIPLHTLLTSGYSRLANA